MQKRLADKILKLPFNEQTLFKDDDIFCCYCGSLTTFAKECKENGEIIPERVSKKGDADGKE